MKKTLLITGVLLALTASVASAAGINMYWNDCGSAGSTAKVFACNTNTGTNNDLYLSFDPPVAMGSVNGNNQFIDLQSAAALLPAWWQFKNVGTCRQTALSTPGTGADACADTWVGQDAPGIAAYLVTANTPTMAVNRARIIGSTSVPGTAVASCTPGTEYYSMTIRITNAKTVGSGLCAGCQDPVCLVLNNIIITQPPGTPGGDAVGVDNPLTNNWVTWQGGAIGGLGCPGATPAINKTWGQLKAIYR